jgi:sialic acid synthase SpsE
MDIDYMRKNLNVLARDIHSYTDAEMARALLRLANVSCADTVRQQLTKPADDTISVSKGEWEAMLETKKNYSDLIMSVERKFTNETRHDTALKYIKHAEMPVTTMAGCSND